MQDVINKIVFGTPGIVDRWGHDLCVETPLYKSAAPCVPIYINTDVFYQVFGIGEKLPYDTIKTLLQNAFSTTIEKSRSTGEIIGTAYVDQQADPLDLSLSGNLGSGRAYYIGKYFNIKGEKTPLAKSKLRKFSDGYLEMERAIWETTIANALQGSITTGIHTVLAIFDMQEMCDVPWRDKPVKRAKIIRVDMDGDLDRVSHYFHQKRNMSKNDLEHTAKSYGVLEANKYIERIVHGTWSAGNISAHGHFIDFDTVNAVKGRTPIYSSTKWHHENRFGFEYMGQDHILKSLCDDADINTDNVDPLHLTNTLHGARKTHIAEGFLKLMGIQDKNQTLYQRYETDIQNLCDMFMELSPKFMAPDPYLLGKSAEAPDNHLYDISFFMRTYPARKKGNIFSPEDAFKNLFQNHFADELETGAEEYNDIEQEYMDKVYDIIGEHAVTDDMTLSFLNLAVIEFIKKYDALFEKITTENNLNINDIIRCAYIMNEDRFYLLPFFTPSYAISQNLDHAQQKMNGFIHANIRHVDHNISDLRLYDEGVYYNALGMDATYTSVIELFDTTKDLPPKILAIINGVKHVLSIEKQGDKTIYRDIPKPLAEISLSITRENTLHVPRISLYTHIEHNEKDKPFLTMHDMIATKDV